MTGTESRNKAKELGKKCRVARKSYYKYKTNLENHYRLNEETFVYCLTEAQMSRIVKAEIQAEIALQEYNNSCWQHFLDHGEIL